MEYRKLKTLAKYPTGKLNSNAAVEDGKYPFFTCAHDIYRIDQYSYDGEYVLLGGNNASGDFPIFYYNGKFDAYQRTYLIQPLSKDTDTKYLYYSIGLKLHQMKANASGTATKFLTQPILNNINIEYRNIEEQKRIADILSTYDNLIENNNKRIKLLEQMAENLYKEWFVRFRFPGYEDVEFESGIPKGWEIKRLFEFGKIETGKTPSKERDQNYGGDIMFIKTPDMHDNIYVISTDEFLSTEGHLTQPKKLLPENSIMVSCIGTGGVVAINDKPAHTNQQINSIILNKSEYLEWLYFVCKNLKETIEMFGATGSTMTNLSKGKFEKLKIVSPPEKAILEYHELTKNLFIEVRVLLHKNELLAKQRNLLLPRLMSGKLEV